MPNTDYPDWGGPQAIADFIGALGLATQSFQATAAQIAASIATAGVPLLGSTAVLMLQSLSPILLNPGTPITYGPFTITQIGYEVLFTCYSAGGAGTYFEVTFTWQDIATGLLVDQQIWSVVPGSNSSFPHTVRGSGPTEGTELVVTITAYGAGVTIQPLGVWQNSRVYPRHDWRTWRVSAYAGAIAQPDGINPGGNILGFKSLSVAAGGTSAPFAVPLYAGRVYLRAKTTSNAADAEVQVQALADSIAGQPTVTKIPSDVAGDVHEYVTLPRSQCVVTLINSNAAAKTITAALTIDG